MLSGIRVLDFTDQSGWIAGRILADLGAEVTKVVTLLVAAKAERFHSRVSKSLT